jgi:glucokinase
MTTFAEAVLLGDIGATNARFACLIDGALGPIKWIEVARHPTFGEAVKRFLEMHPRDIPVAHALLAVAGPVEGERCTFTNCPWTVDCRDMRDQFGFRSVQVVNDFEATALSLPHLAKQDLRSIGGGRAMRGAPMVVLGPGSGLGVAGLVPDGAGHVVVASEGGHATMPANSVREDAVLDFLRQRSMVYVSVEPKKLIRGGLHGRFVGSKAVQHCSPLRTHIDSLLSKLWQPRDAVIELIDRVFVCVT